MATTAPPNLETDPEQRLLPRGSRDRLRIIPLGGVGEFGLNMTCYEAGDDRILVDCGGMFPDADMLGVDLVIPDVQFLLSEPERLKGIVLTHAHEDHIGALPYILTQINVPIYATAMTLAYLSEKLEEHDLLDQVELIEMEYRRRFSLGENFEIEPLHVTHSIAGAAALAIHTPAGVAVHTGDYKIDYSPIDGHAFDFYGFSKLGEQGVLALVGDSTNANVPGSTQTERWVARKLEPVFASSEGTIFCATFSTSVHRLQVLLNLAERFGRKVFVAGRSLERTFRIAADQGCLRIPPRLLCGIQEFNSSPPEERLALVTGSQGEAMAVLSRLARGEHKKLSIEEDDTVILSARAIPNNIRSINHMIDHLCRRGARILDSSSAEVHASGHAYREEVKALISLTRPRFLVPVHGELRQLLAHRDVALSLGFDDDSIFVLADGDVLEMQEKETGAEADLIDTVPTGRVLVDGKTVGETGDVVLRDRRHLSEDGMLIAILNIDKRTGELLMDPEIVTRGFVYVDESEELIRDLVRLVRETFEACCQESRIESEVINPEIRRALRKLIRKNYDRYPLILPVIQEI